MEEKKNLKYQTVVDWILQNIRSGLYPIEQKIPSEHTLVATTGFSRQTIRKAIACLEEEKILKSQKGRGTFVVQEVKKRQIGFVSTYINDYIFPNITQGIENVLTAQHCSLTLGITKNQWQLERQILLSMIKEEVSGIIIEGSKTALPNPNLDLFALLDQKKIPYVFIHAYYPSLCPSFVVTNDLESGAKAYRYLHNLGHSQIGGIFKIDDLQGHWRYQGFSQENRLCNHSLEDKRIVWYDSSQLFDLFHSAWGMKLLAPLLECTAIVCYNDEVAKELISFLQREKVRVPEDISIVGFDNSLLSELSPIKITSLAHPGELLGEKAAELLLEKIKQKQNKSVPSSLILDMSLVEKDSCKK